MFFCLDSITLMFFYLLPSCYHQVERPGTGNQSHYAWAPSACVAHVSDAPQPADPHSRRCPHASVGAAGPLHQPGWHLASPKDKS